MRVLVMTVVHHPSDARISFRQIPALLAAGHSVTYAAPFTARGTQPPDGVTPVDLPAATGRHRLAAIRSARRAVKNLGATHDLVLLHDPDLLLAVRGQKLPPVVWDVHEDTMAALGMRDWLPQAVTPAARTMVQRWQRWADRHTRLLIAEAAYQSLFTQRAVVVPNTTLVPTEVTPPGAERVVYLGAVTKARGAEELIGLAGQLPDGVTLHVVGPIAPEVATDLNQASTQLPLVLHGFLPNDQALKLVDGALAGVSLLHDEPNYRHSQPTKVIEYMAHGVPVISTPLPLAAGLITTAACGVLVPFGQQGPIEAALAIQTLRDNPTQRAKLGAAGHAAAQRDHDWASAGPKFVAALEAFVSPRS